MGHNNKDVYYNEDHFGLKQVAGVNWSEESYEFDMTIIWSDKDGQLYLARDSGCSCNAPFEGYTTLESLSKMTKYEVAADLQNDLKDEPISKWGPSREDLEAEVYEAIANIMREEYK